MLLEEAASVFFGIDFFWIVLLLKFNLFIFISLLFFFIKKTQIYFNFTTEQKDPMRKAETPQDLVEVQRSGPYFLFNVNCGHLGPKNAKFS